MVKQEHYECTSITASCFIPRGMVQNIPYLVSSLRSMFDPVSSVKPHLRQQRGQELNQLGACGCTQRTRTSSFGQIPMELQALSSCENQMQCSIHNVNVCICCVLMHIMYIYIYVNIHIQFIIHTYYYVHIHYTHVTVSSPAALSSDLPRLPLAQP